MYVWYNYPVYKYITTKQYLEYHGAALRLVLSIRITMKIIRNQAGRNRLSNDWTANDLILRNIIDKEGFTLDKPLQYTYHTSWQGTEEGWVILMVGLRTFGNKLSNWSIWHQLLQVLTVGMTWCDDDPPMLQVVLVPLAIAVLALARDVGVGSTNCRRKPPFQNQQLNQQNDMCSKKY